MPNLVIAAYRPKPGKERELLALVKEHLPILRGQGLASERPSLVLRAQDGTLLEIFEWASEEATQRAHHDPVVGKMWERFGAVCDYVNLGQLAEAAQPFPHFELVEL
jgi:hypothetical protein